MKASLRAVHPVLAVPDVAASVRFYSRLGFACLFQDHATEPKYAVLHRDGAQFHLQWADAGQWASTTECQIDRPAYRFLVDDVDALYAEFAAAGAINAQTGQGSPWAAPADTPWGTREFHLRDPGQSSLQFYRDL